MPESRHSCDCMFSMQKETYWHRLILELLWRHVHCRSSCAGIDHGVCSSVRSVRGGHLWGSKCGCRKKKSNYQQYRTYILCAETTDTILTLVNSGWITCCSDGAPTGMLGRCGRKIRHSIVESVRNTILIEKRATVNGGRRSGFIRSVEWLW